MLKGTKIVFLFIASLLCVTSCSKSKTYADYLKEERENLKKYINAAGIIVQNAKPEGEGEWKEGDKDIYFQSASGLYYHQIYRGSGTRYPVVNSTVYVRYKGMNLSGNVIYDCTDAYAPNPEKFIITSSSSGEKYGPGFQEAVKNMTRGGQCRVIIPFNIGNGYNTTLNNTTISDAANYTTMIYEIELVNVD